MSPSDLSTRARQLPWPTYFHMAMCPCSQTCGSKSRKAASLRGRMSQSAAKRQRSPNITTSLGREAHGQEYEQQGICLALVLRSEGLMALPLRTTSVTRNVKVDFHAGKEKHDFLRDVTDLFIFGLKFVGVYRHFARPHVHRFMYVIAFFAFLAKAKPSLLLLLPSAA